MNTAHPPIEATPTQALATLAALTDRTPSINLDLEPFDALAAFPGAEWETVETGSITWLRATVAGVEVNAWPAHRHTDANRVACRGAVEAARQMVEVTA